MSRVNIIRMSRRRKLVRNKQGKREFRKSLCLGWICKHGKDGADLEEERGRGVAQKGTQVEKVQA